MIGNKKRGSAWGGTKAAVWGLTVFTLVSCLALVGCKTDETENPAGWKLGQLPPDLTFGPTVALFYIGNKWISSSFTSTDGKTWTYDINDTTVPRGISGVAYGGTGADAKFVAVGSSGRIVYSTDGTAWQQVTTDNNGGFGTNNISGVAYGGTGDDAKWVAVGNYGNIAYSTDGTTWQAVTAANNGVFGTYNIVGVAYGGTGDDAKFVALRSGDKIAYSTDGITWQEVTSSILSGIQGMQNLFYGGDKFFVYSYTGNVYSRDGTTWIKVESGDVAIGSKMAYGNGKWVTDTGAISTNGITWTQGTRPTFQESPNSDVQNATVTNIAYGGGKFVALGTITRQLPGNTNMVWYLED